MYFCGDYGSNKKWKVDSAGRIVHVGSGKCVTAPDGNAGSELALSACADGDLTQVWDFEFSRVGAPLRSPNL